MNRALARDRVARRLSPLLAVTSVLVGFSLTLLAVGAPPKTIVLRNATVIDGAASAPLAASNVVIRNGVIIAVGPAKRVAVPKGAQVIDAAGLYVIPGLWDMHVHLTMAGENSFALFVANGVTSVRDLGGDFAKIRAWREEIETGKRIGPRVKTAGVVLESPRFLSLLGRVAAALPAPYNAMLQQTMSERLAVATPEEVRQAVTRLKAEGADCLKFRSNASPEILRALGEGSRRASLPLAGHAPTGMGPAEAGEAGLRSFEHSLTAPGAEVADADIPQLVARLRASGAMVTPTLITARGTRLTSASEVDQIMDDSAGQKDPRRRYVSAGLLDHWRLQKQLDQFESPTDWHAAHAKAVKLLRDLHQAGVPLLAGTDLGARLVYPGWSLHDELELLVNELGLTPMQALQAATTNAARFFDLEATLGTIQPGRAADLVLLTANPLENIANTKKIAGVVLRGQYLDRKALDQLLAEAQRAAVASFAPR